ncbi:SMP-30/gluconolactonase/LRE family protein [Pendulispora albinea]|uniref:Superoxide dismutase n=1 Tax=Pendulispora albinea TaxID=2741071 RepID=A0ABZ2LVM9_9BACT
MRCKFLAAFSIALLSQVYPLSPALTESAPLGTVLGPGVAHAEPDERFPTTIALPNGFRPEGIAIGLSPVAYFGSLADGSIYQANLRNGEGKIISKGPGTPSVGLKVDDRHRLFVAGGVAGNARVIDARSGNVLASYTFATGESFINDVVLTHDAAWFTDSRVPVLYKLPLGRGGELPAPDKVVRLPLSGEIVFTTGTNANGIVTSPDRRSLVLVQSNTGKLFQVNPNTGATRAVDLGGESVPGGDGLLRIGHALFVVQNRLNQVAEIDLERDGSKGKLIRRVTDPRFDVPTTIAVFRDRLYLPNARFNTPPTPTTPYNAVAIEIP